MIAASTAGPNLSWAEVCARRLRRHALAAPAPRTAAADVVGAMCGAHAQVMSAAELSIGLRLAGATRADVREALWTERSLVKTRGPRGTVHLLPARDLPMWTGALSALPSSQNLWPDDVRMTPEQTDAVLAAIADVLADAELTVDELTEALVAVTGPWAGDRVIDAFQDKWPRWRQVEDTAANRGALCFGPPRGRRVTYTSPRRWLPAFQPTDGPTALADLARRYLHAYGPATPAHFAQWLNAPRGWAGELFDSLSGELERVTVEGTPAWQLAASAATAAAVSATAAADTADTADNDHGVRLLPYFDAYTVGCHPRELLFPGRAAERALSGGQGGNFPVLLIGGTVAGVWHQRRSGRKIEITVEPLGRLTAAQRHGLDEQAERVGEILEGTPNLSIGTVTVGGHA